MATARLAERIRTVLAAQGEGLASLCFRTNDITKLHRRLDRLTLKPEPVTEVESRDAVTEATLSWKRTRAASDATRGIRMFFLELAKERPLSVRTGPASITAMDHVVVSTPDPERAAALYGARLGLDMALDRSHPDWGRLMFFRCGDLIVEVTHRPGKPAAGTQEQHDRLRGLCWRVADIDATHARLTAAGVDVSEVRTGRKPGTRVMTVRNGTCGVPTLLVQPSASQGMIFPSPLVGEGGRDAKQRGRVRGLSPRMQTSHPARTLSAPPSPTRGEGKRCASIRNLFLACYT